MLRSFLDAQLVVADRLAAPTPPARGRATLLEECDRVGRQMLLQRRLHSPESVSRELFASAINLAENLGLLGPGGDDGGPRRRRRREHRLRRQPDRSCHR